MRKVVDDRIRTVGVDVVTVAAVAGLVTVVHILAPEPLKAQLAFDYRQFNLPGLLTAAYVHRGDQHLFGNLVAYVAAAAVAYQLCRLADERRWFHRTFLVLLLVLPVLVNLTSYVTITAIQPIAMPTSRGFSGVAAGFAGFVFTALLVLLSRTYSWRTTRYLGLGVSLVLLWEVALIYTGGIRLDIAGMAVAGLSLNAWGIVRDSEWPDSRSAWQDRLVTAVFGCLIVVLLGLFVFTLFPAEVTSDGTTTNVIAHGVGFVYGAGLAGLVFLLTAWR